MQGTFIHCRVAGVTYTEEGTKQKEMRDVFQAENNPDAKSRVNSWYWWLRPPGTSV